MTRRRTIAVGVAFVIFCSFVFLWLYAPYIKARLLLSTLDYDRGRNVDALGPSMCGLKFWDFHLDTATDDIDTWCIRSLYNSTCERVQEEFGASSMSSYSYNDDLGYGRQITVVQLRGDLDSASYLAMEKLNNNDNDMFRFAHRRGIFDATGKHPLATWQLHSGLQQR